MTRPHGKPVNGPDKAEPCTEAPAGGTFWKIREIVRGIPAGKAATYGQIARLAGMPRGARTVGYALAACRDASVPCHRVVDRFGGTKVCFDAFAPGAQRTLLEAEGVPFCPDGTVDLERCRWEPELSPAGNADPEKTNHEW